MRGLRQNRGHPTGAVWTAIRRRLAPHREVLAPIVWRWRRRTAAWRRRLRGLPTNPSPQEYREARRAQLESCADLASRQGLEIGAGALPTLREGEGSCVFADFRSADELGSRLGFADEDMEPITFLIEREKPLSQQLQRRFDYIILCHVLEHVPEPIGYLADLAEMLYPGGHILVALPDKRQTGDAPRPSTRLEELLDAHFRNVSKPSLTQVLEMGRAWNPEIATLADRDPRAYYELGVQQVLTPDCDAHCHVWRDDEFFGQIEWLARGGFLGPTSVRRTSPCRWPFNEFYAVLERDDDIEGEPEGQLVQAPRSIERGGRLYWIDRGRKRWVHSPEVLEARGLGGQRIWQVSEEVLDRFPDGPGLNLP